MIPILVSGHNPGPKAGRGTNTYLLPGRVPTLIDTGSGQPQYLPALESALDNAGLTDLVQVLVTHAHPDHAGGVEAIRSRWPRIILRKMRWPEQDGRFAASWAPLGDGDEISAGDAILRAVHTPGHAPDHLCFFEEETRILFTGDLVVGEGTVVIPASAGGSLQQYLASLRRVLALAPTKLFPGHGPEVADGPSLISHYLAHRQEREEQIVAILQQGRATVGSIVDRVYEQLPPELSGMAAESVTAHLIKLEAEGRVVRDERHWILIDR